MVKYLNPFDPNLTPDQKRAIREQCLKEVKEGRKLLRKKRSNLKLVKGGKRA